MVIADYRRIANEIQQQIESGELSPGDKLPSTSKLALKYKVSESTISRAVGLLHDRGLVYGHPGKGVFVGQPETP
jgi:DNA-binding GntR family transcriptional regulator